jgi:hypothetical protein
MTWRLFVAAVTFLGRLAGPIGAPLIRRGWTLPRFGERLFNASSAAAFFLIPLSALMSPAQVRPQEFERLRTQVEGQHDRLNRIEISLENAKSNIAAMQVGFAENIGPIQRDINALKWILGILAGCLMACMPLAFKAGRWYQKTEHISGERTPVK